MPLLPLGRRLRETKGGCCAESVSQAEVQGLISVERIQRDVQEIYTWPFDTGVVVRLSAIIFSVAATAIVSARTIASLLGF